MNWRMRLSMAIDTARGMHYLHRRAGIIQRDLKSANLLVDEYYNIKIADFGLVCIFPLLSLNLLFYLLIGLVLLQ